MNNDLSDPAGDCTSIRIDIRIDESWIDKFLTDQQLVIPINEQHSLTNIRIKLTKGTLHLQADVKDKEGSSIEVTSKPVWDEASQQIKIEDLKLNTTSKNLLLKSAGWFAQTFLNSRIDAKIEEQANLMYRKQLANLRSKPISIPMPNRGIVQIVVSDIKIHHLTIVDQALEVSSTIDAYSKIHLS